MVLDSLENGIDIGRLVLEEPKLEKTDLLFDPERDLEISDWEKVKNDLRGIMSLGNGYLRYARDALVIFPKKVDDIATEHIWREAKESLDHRFMDVDNYPNSESDLAVLIDTVGSILRVFPHRREYAKKYYENYADSIFELMSSDSKHFFWRYKQLIVNAVFLFPEAKNRPKLMLDMTKDYLTTYPEGASLPKDNLPFVWKDFTENISIPRMLFSDYKPDIPQDYWVKMKAVLNNFRTEGINFTNLAANLTILAAEDVQVTDQGLEITMVKPNPTYTEVVPPLPEVRKF